MQGVGDANRIAMLGYMSGQLSSWVTTGKTLGYKSKTREWKITCEMEHSDKAFMNSDLSSGNKSKTGG